MMMARVARLREEVLYVTPELDSIMEGLNSKLCRHGLAISDDATTDVACKTRFGNSNYLCPGRRHVLAETYPCDRLNQRLQSWLKPVAPPLGIHR